MDNIEKLYQHYETLNEAKDQISQVSNQSNWESIFALQMLRITLILKIVFYLQHEDKFSEIIQAVKGSANEKRLASQFIARFFKHFPKLSDTAMDAMLDLCEDDDVAVSWYQFFKISLQFLIIKLYLDSEASY